MNVRVSDCELEPGFLCPASWSHAECSDYSNGHVDSALSWLSTGAVKTGGDIDVRAADWRWVPQGYSSSVFVGWSRAGFVFRENELSGDESFVVGRIHVLSGNSVFEMVWDNDDSHRSGLRLLHWASAVQSLTGSEVTPYTVSMPSGWVTRHSRVSVHDSAAWRMRLEARIRAAELYEFQRVNLSAPPRTPNVACGSCRNRNSCEPFSMGWTGNGEIDKMGLEELVASYSSAKQFASLAKKRLMWMSRNGTVRADGISLWRESQSDSFVDKDAALRILRTIVGSSCPFSEIVKVYERKRVYVSSIRELFDELASAGLLKCNKEVALQRFIELSISERELRPSEGRGILKWSRLSR